MKLEAVIPKSDARRIAVQRKQELSESEIRNKTSLLFEKFLDSDEFIHSKVIHTYISGRPGEIQNRPLIDKMHCWGKTIILPKLNKHTGTFKRYHFTGWNDIVKNNEGYWEPQIAFDGNLDDIDLIIVPAMAVSKYGHRIGYGGGYYDRLLKTVRCTKCVLALEFQIFKAIEHSPEDVRIDKIFTERRVIDTNHLSGKI